MRTDITLLALMVATFFALPICAADRALEPGWSEVVVRVNALSRGGILLATSSEDGTVKLWRARELMDQANSEADRKRKQKKYGE